MEHEGLDRPTLAQLAPHANGREVVLWKKTLCLGGVQIAIKAYVDRVEFVIRQLPAIVGRAS